MIINKQKHIKFNNEASCIVDYSELEKAILWYQEKPTASNKKIYMHGNYPAVSIHDKKIHVHRLLMSFWLDCKIPPEYSVHHVNEDKLDARKENLSLVLNSTHNRKHMKGAKFTKHHREKIAEANRKRRGLKMKRQHQIPVEELGELLEKGFTISYIAQLYGCDWTTVKSRIYENPELLENN